MYVYRYIDTYLLICYRLQFLQACGGACSITASIPIICRTIFVFKVYPKGRSCSQPTRILKWLLVTLPDYSNKLHAVNLFYMFVSCVVLMYRLLTLTHDPVFYIPCWRVPASPYSERRVLCTSIELLLRQESISSERHFHTYKNCFYCPKGEGYVKDRTWANILSGWKQQVSSVTERDFFLVLR